MKTNINYFLYTIITILFSYNIQAQYCVSSPVDNLNSLCDIVQLAGNSITLNKNTTSICSDYSDFITGENIPDLLTNSSYTINITQGSCGVTTENRTANAWIDFNNDGDFIDANEMLGAGTTVSDINGYVHSYTFTIPSGATIGNTRMRVIVKKGAGGTTNPCHNNYSSGETEDYTIQVIDDTLSIPNFEKNQIGIYPNPTNSLIYINGIESELEIINVYNFIGQNVTKKVTFTENNEQKKVLDLSKLNSGIYIIKTKTTANKVYKK